MSKALVFGLTALMVGIGAAALAWRSHTAAPAGETVAAQVADAPSARDIFPKVLNH